MIPPSAEASSHLGEKSNPPSIFLHPLVVINISDHFTRICSANISSSTPAGTSSSQSIPKTWPRAIGILIGTQQGRNIDLCHSFEIPFTTTFNSPIASLSRSSTDMGNLNEENITIDLNFMHHRIEQFKKIFPDYEVLGWYSTGSRPTDDDVRIHQSVISQINESPVYLLVNPIQALRNSDTSSTPTPSKEPIDLGICAPIGSQPVSLLATSSNPGQTPITIYEAERRFEENMESKVVLVPVDHQFASADAERIAVDHVTRLAHTTGEAGDTAETTQHLRNLQNATRVLLSRISIVDVFLKATRNKTISKDHQLLRLASTVCSRLPNLDNAFINESMNRTIADQTTTSDALDVAQMTSHMSSLRTSSMEESDDSRLVQYMTGVTKSLCMFNELIDNFNFAYNSNISFGYESKRPKGAF